MKIYTKTGDSGFTSLIGGKRVPKFHERIEAYGDVDELISYIGLLRDNYNVEYYQQLLLWIQDRLMVCSSLLAFDNEGSDVMLPTLSDEDIYRLEKEIDKMESFLSPLTSFVLPGGYQAVSICHINRSICRRSERKVVKLSESEKLDEIIIKFLNRLSDFFFVLSRQISKDLKADEIPWDPKL